MIYGITRGAAHNGLLMGALADGEITTPTFLLLFTGFVMILTLWFSKKARHVIDTGVNLSRQSEGGEEKFSSNFLSRFLVRITVICANAVEFVMPKSLSRKIDRRFEKPEPDPNVKEEDLPAFDLVRAAINLVVSSSLIAFGTSFKLPLSTTYVTFMVAMGSSLADRAWGARQCCISCGWGAKRNWRLVLNCYCGFLSVLLLWLACCIMAV